MSGAKPPTPTGAKPPTPVGNKSATPTNAAGKERSTTPARGNSPSSPSAGAVGKAPAAASGSKAVAGMAPQKPPSPGPKSASVPTNAPKSAPPPGKPPSPGPAAKNPATPARAPSPPTKPPSPGPAGAKGPAQPPGTKSPAGKQPSPPRAPPTPGAKSAAPTPPSGKSTPAPTPVANKSPARGAGPKSEGVSPAAATSPPKAPPSSVSPKRVPPPSDVPRASPKASAGKKSPARVGTPSASAATPDAASRNNTPDVEEHAGAATSSPGKGGKGGKPTPKAGKAKGGAASSSAGMDASNAAAAAALLNSSSGIPVANIVIAADKDVIEDWRERNIHGECPFNTPLREFIERLLYTRLKWENGLSELVVVETRGTDFTSAIPVPEAVIHVALTPKELRWDAGSTYFCWLQRAGKQDGPMKTRAELFKERLRRFYQYYAPEKEPEVNAILTDFDGSEDLLFSKLTAMYGAEPTDHQLRRAIHQRNASLDSMLSSAGRQHQVSTVAPWVPDGSAKPAEAAPSAIGKAVREMQVQHLKDTGRYDPNSEATFNPYRRTAVEPTSGTAVAPVKKLPPRSDDATGYSRYSAEPGRGAAEGYDAVLGAASSEIRKSVTGVFGRLNESLLLGVYYKRWILWRLERLQQKRVVQFLRGNFDAIIRKDYYVKWRQYVGGRNMRRQVQQSTQLAAKSESLVGDLATENSSLKGEIKRLRAQVEMLDNNNARRLESLYSSSELAVAQIRTLSTENQQKERLIQELEQRLMNVGNMMLQANDEKEKVLEATAAERVRLEGENDTLHHKVMLLEDALAEANEQLKKWKPKPQPASCVHCPHYFDLQREVDVHVKNADVLRARIKDAEAERAKAQESMLLLAKQVKQQENRSYAIRSSPHRRSSRERAANSPVSAPGYSSGDVSRDASPSPPPPPPEDDDDDAGSAASSAASFADHRVQATPPLPAFDSVGASFAAPVSRREQQGYGEPTGYRLPTSMAAGRASALEGAPRNNVLSAAPAPRTLGDAFKQSRDPTVTNATGRSFTAGGDSLSGAAMSLVNNATFHTHQQPDSFALGATAGRGGYGNAAAPAAAVVQQPSAAVRSSRDEPVALTSASMSLGSFFNAEEKRLDERLRQSMDRQTHNRLRTSGFSLQHGTIARDVEQRFHQHEAQVLQNVRGVAGHLQHPAAAAHYGVAGSTALSGVASNDELTRARYDAAQHYLLHGSQPHERPVAQPARLAVETQLQNVPGVPPPDPAAMRRSIFASSGRF